jgi:dTDP-glucose pyrophosphorylase
MSDLVNHVINSGSTIREALIQLNELGVDSTVFVVNNEMNLMGSLTDGDIRRGLIKGIKTDSDVDSVMNTEPKFISITETDFDKILKFREDQIKIIPVINSDNKVIRVINLRELKSYLPLDVVIMAGGRGQRLRPLTDTTPKPLLQIDGIPIIERNLNRLTSFGISNFWITLNYRGDQIQHYLTGVFDRKINIDFVWEDEPLGTIGAVSKISNFKKEYILIMNSDLLTNLDYEHFYIDFIRSGADMSVVTIPYQVKIPYGVLETENGLVTQLKEKPTYIYHSNGGIYIVKRAILDTIPRDTHFDATDLMEQLIQNGGKVTAYSITGYWLDIGNHDDYIQANKDVHTVNFG